MPSIVDWMTAFGQFLRTTPLPGFALWVQKQPLSMVIDKNYWFVPSLQVIHILAIAALFGSVVMMNLRIFMLAGRSRTMTQTVRRFLPWVWWALAVLLVSGLGLVLGDVVRNLTNPVFWTKMVLVSVAALLSLFFQFSVTSNVALWEATHPGRIAVRFAAAGIIVLWCTIMVCGRWIAYAPT